MTGPISGFRLERFRVLISPGCMALLALVFMPVETNAAADDGVRSAVGQGSATAVAAQDFATSHPGVALFRQPSGRISTVHGPSFSSGDTAEHCARQFVEGQARLFGVVAGDLMPSSLLDDARHTQPLCWDPAAGRFRFTLVYFTQVRDGFPVFRADLRLVTRNEPGFPLVLAKSALRDLGAFRVPADWHAETLSLQAAQDIVRKRDPDLVNYGASRMVIWAGYDDMTAEPRLAYEFVADNTGVGAPEPKAQLFLVDAMNGAILFSESQIFHVDVTGSVRALVTDGTAADACGPESSQPMPYARLTLGATTAFADVNGNYTIPNAGSSDVTVISPVSGRYFVVADQGGPLDTLSQTVTPPGPANFEHNAANSSELVRSEVNAYLHANIVRDYALAHNPVFPVVADQTDFPIVVNVSTFCNAAYVNGSRLEFSRSGSGCTNSGFGTVVHHEYGHHLVASAGSGQGEYGEGMGDVVALLVTDDPGVAVGLHNDCSQALRSAENDCQYSATGCSSCGSEIHICGQLLSGCVWSARNALLMTNPSSYRQVISDLAINSMLLHSGTQITPELTIDYLTLDDNDANILNGTPHYAEIASGFGAHNMPAPTVELLEFDYPSGRPTLLDPAGGPAFTVNISGAAAAPEAGTGMLFYSTGSGYRSVPLEETSPNRYTAVFPAIPCGAAVSYFVAAATSDGAAVFHPSAGPFAPFTADSATSTALVFSDDFETDVGWVVGGPDDNATGGHWLWGDPVGTAAQPEDDHTPDGVNCFFTGQGPPGGTVGQADVDGGQTTLTSPTIDLSDTSLPRLSYWRWYSNDRGNGPNSDVMLVQLSNDDGANWLTVETVGPAGADTRGGWIFNEVHISSLLVPTATMKIRFIASDLGLSSIVEAAVDDIAITSFGCTPNCPADFNDDGGVNSQDFFDFLTAFFAQAPSADFNNDSIINSQDFFDFLAAFFEGCP